MTITTTQTQALATFVNRCRPDWDHPGIVAAINKAARTGDALTIATALIRLAGNAELKSPALLAAPGRHWQVGPDVKAPRETYDVPCVDHPEHVHPCPRCRDEKPPLTPEAIAELRAVVAARRTPVPKFVTPKADEDRAAHLDRLRRNMEAS